MGNGKPVICLLFGCLWLMDPMCSDVFVWYLDVFGPFHGNLKGKVVE